MPSREKPILMSAPMVRAILDGTKTQTRRVIKPQPVEGVYKYDGMTPTFAWRDEINTCRPAWPDVMNSYSPYGQPGDRLWVRETWRDLNGVQYRADTDSHGPVDGSADAESPNWRPSIFMPRALSRITLEITDVRVQRVQEISMHDAMDEGVGFPKYSQFEQGSHLVGAFRDLWESINAKRGYDWASNPWVWALTFKRI